MMKIADAITRVDRLKPNQYSIEMKIGWLAQVEDQIFEEIVSTHENRMHIQRPRLDADSDPETMLIAPFPYDEVYIHYLFSKIDQNNMEIAKYNNDVTLFNNSYQALRDYWNRHYMPVERVHTFAFDDRRRLRIKPYDGHKIIPIGNPLDMHRPPMPPHPPMKPGPGKPPIKRERYAVPVPVEEPVEETEE